MKNIFLPTLVLLSFIDHSSYSMNEEGKDDKVNPSYAISPRVTTEPDVPIDSIQIRGQMENALRIQMENGIHGWEDHFERNPEDGFSYKTLTPHQRFFIAVNGMNLEVSAIGKSHNRYRHSTRPSASPWKHDESLHMSYEIKDIFLKDGETDILRKDNFQLPSPVNHILQEEYKPLLGTLVINPHNSSISLEVEVTEWFYKPDGEGRYRGKVSITKDLSPSVEHVRWDHNPKNHYSTQIINIIFTPPNGENRIVLKEEVQSTRSFEHDTKYVWTHYDRNLSSDLEQKFRFMTTGAFNNGGMQQEVRGIDTKTVGYQRFEKDDEVTFTGPPLWRTTYLRKAYKRGDDSIYKAPAEVSSIPISTQN